MAVEFMKRSVPGLGTKYTVEEMGAALPEHFRRDDRRRLVGLPTTDAQGFVDGMRAYFELRKSGNLQQVGSWKEFRSSHPAMAGTTRR